MIKSSVNDKKETRADSGPFFVEPENMPRIKIDGFPIGCPATHGEGNCPLCGGGWPGTTSPSRALIKAAEKGRLNPGRLGCGTLEEQGKFLVAYFSRNREGVRKINPEPEDENDCGVGPAEGGIYGQALVNLAAGSSTLMCSQESLTEP